jgi:cytochrome c oxidase subunit 4
MTSHILLRRTYLYVFAALMALLVLTLAVSRWDLGPFHLPATLLIAAAKTLLILLYFMHLRTSPPLTQLFAAAGFLWLLVMLFLAFGDYQTRTREGILPHASERAVPATQCGTSLRDVIEVSEKCCRKKTRFCL